MADTVILKNGEKLDGKITAETATEITVEYHETPSILETKTVKKTDIDKVEKEQPDEIAYLALKGTQPGPNSLPGTSYSQVLRPLQAFLVQYPKSAHAAEVSKTVEAFQADQKRVDSGELKFNNRWLSKEEAEKERVQLTGQALLGSMQDQSRRGDYIGALNTFDQFEKAAPGAKAYADAVDLAKQGATSLKGKADSMLANAKVHNAQRDKDMQLLSAAERAATVAAVNRQTAQENAAVEAANKAGSAWPPLLPNNEKVLADISSKAAEAKSKYTAIPIADIRKSIALSEGAREKIAKGDVDGATAALQQAQQLWSSNEMVARLTSDLKDAPAKAAAEAAPAPEEKPAPTAETAPTPPAPTPTAEAPVADQPAVEEKESFIKTPFGMVVCLLGVILVLGAIGAYRKVSKKANEIIE